MIKTGWPIRRKLIALLLLPLVSLAVVLGYAAELSLGNALTLAHENTIGNHLARPLGRVVIALRVERRYAATALAAGRPPSGMFGSRDSSDGEIAAFLEHAHMGSVREVESDQVRAGVDAAERALEDLPSLRLAVDSRRITPAQEMVSYTSIDKAIGEALRGMTVLPDQVAQEFGQALYQMVPAGEILSQEDALVSAAAAGPQHHLSTSDYSTLVACIGAQRYLHQEAISRLPAEQRAPLMQLASPNGAAGRLSALENKIVAAGPHANRLPFPITEWRAAYDAEDAAAGALSLKDISAIFDRTGPPAHRAFLELIFVGLFGLLALAVAVVMSLSVGRSLIGDVSRLRTSARNLTDDRLRDVIGRLRRGEKVDVQSDMTRPDFVNREMAELGQAFWDLQLTAVDLADEDIRLREGISKVFLSLARRSQVLVHRQLKMLDAMERRTEDPVALEELFHLDQLATRMRRYAEGLIIVSGAKSGRVWRQPVPVIDVIRGAIAETEHYARVVILPVPAVGVVGHATADVIHLLAELIENAQTFSPAESDVQITTSNGENGLIIEVEDRGLGMPSEALAAANARINSPIDVIELDSTRLGLVTVSRLAKRHGIRVSLSISRYSGVNAVVVIPHSILGRKSQDGGPEPITAATPGLSAPRALTTGNEPASPHGTGAFPSLAATPAGAEVNASPGWPEPVAIQSPFSPSEALSGSDTVDGLPRRVPQGSVASEFQHDPEHANELPFDWRNTSLEQVRGDSPHTPAPPRIWDTNHPGARHGRATEGAVWDEGPPHQGTYATNSVTARPMYVQTMMSSLQAGILRARLLNPQSSEANESQSGYHYDQGRPPQ
ncbi:nitrate- and nitrite sensing domain-containing protein [Streptomyces sp. NPDC051664]|uniref:sensor histidine kinase n=1 Tax=Streptomyces sp. NPDC051664 TaxID=3365668 RepID=UPI0037A8FEAF